MVSSTPSPSPTPPLSNMKPSTTLQISTNSPKPFDIVATYSSTRLTSPDLPPALLAIQCLTTALTVTPVSTLSETLTLLSTLSSTLKTALPRRAIPISAGTDLFQRYLVTTHARPRPKQHDRDDEEEGDDDFETTKAAIIRAGNTFVTRGITARTRIAALGREFIRAGDTILVPAPSRAVAAMLAEAADQGTYFRVVFVQSATSAATDSTTSQRAHNVTQQLTASLRAAEVPVVFIPAAGVGHTLRSLSRPSKRSVDSPIYVLAGAAALLSNGSVLGALGTQNAAILAKEMGLQVVVVAESFKCARWEPGMGKEGTGLVVQGVEFMDGGRGDEWKTETGRTEEEVDLDVTPAVLVNTIVTEHGPTTPAAIAEDIIKIWF